MKNKLIEVVIVGAIRTPIGTFKGSLRNMRSDELGSIVIKEVLNKSKFSSEEILPNIEPESASFNSLVIKFAVPSAVLSATLPVKPSDIITFTSPCMVK